MSNEKIISKRFECIALTKNLIKYRKFFPESTGIDLKLNP
jgi:hypothetical protein|tara:strand:+ start:719 stop:838 length:120 start_codon:yes stop_codon:yes gene_type:complete